MARTTGTAAEGRRPSRPSRTTLGGTMAPGVTPGTAVTTKHPRPHGSRTRRTAIRAPAATRPRITRAPAVTRPTATQQADIRLGDIRTQVIRAMPTKAIMPMATGGNGHRAPYDPRADYRRLTYPG